MVSYSMGGSKGMQEAQANGRQGVRFSSFAPDSPTTKDERASTPSSDNSHAATPTSGRKKDVIQPTFALLFSLTTRSSQLSILIPATFLSIICGLIPPYMTELLGRTFGAFTTYTITTSNPTLTSDQIAAARSILLNSTRNSSFQFVGLAVAVIVASSASVALWVINGERTIKALRLKVFKGVGARSMAWYDLGMGAQDIEEEEGGEEAGQGAGGLMGRFSKCVPSPPRLPSILIQIDCRETDDVRVAASQTVGLVVQYFTSFLVCLVLSFYRDYRLTFVVLSSIPAVTLIVIFTERLAGPLSELDRDYASKCSSRVDRILGAITTVKAFNAEEKEISGFAALSNEAHIAYSKLHFVWGTRTGGTQFVLLSMFVQGFWFGSYLVRNGSSTAAAVNTCFWACLLASTYLQMCIPLLVTLEKGKTAMAGLLELAKEETSDAPSSGRPVSMHSLSLVPSLGYGKGMERITSIDISEPFALDTDLPLTPHPYLVRSPSSPTFPHPMSPIAGPSPRRRGPVARPLRKLRPDRFSGELSLQNVTFHYPSRPFPAPPALQDVSLYLASNETTYIVGGSGSGKSTVGSLLLGLYSPDEGTIEVDEQGLEWIDQSWLRGHVACVSQGASVLFDGTVHDNVAIGVVGQIQADGKLRRVEDVTREEVVAACRGALMHEFVRDLPEGYDTFLSGEKGASLSGGQRQRLAIARAWLRDPTVLILGEFLLLRPPRESVLML
jgi:ATP-binding cassette subfamily B (MDR/TAP) protein 1